METCVTRLLTCRVQLRIFSDLIVSISISGTWLQPWNEEEEHRNQGAERKTEDAG